MATQLLNETEIDEISQQLLLDIDDLVRLTTFSKTWLEDNLLRDPRIRRYQRQPYERGKRVWLAKPTLTTIKEIVMNEWN